MMMKKRKFTSFFIKCLVLVLSFCAVPFFADLFNINQRVIVKAAIPKDSIASLAKCLNSRGFKMYGTEECSACDIEKGYFEKSFKFITYINCDVERQLCQSKNIRAYPTWEDQNNQQYKGAMTLETLASISGCSLVEKKTQRFQDYNLSQLLTAFIAGLLSFLAPCLLPLLPSYFSVITGFTFADLYGLNFEKIRARVFISVLFFILGFTLVFTMLGATGSIVGQLIDKYLSFFLRLSGVFLISLGLVQVGIIKPHALEFDFAWRVQRRLTHLGFLTAGVTGVAAAISWIPCIGPLLTPILALSAKSETVIYGLLLLFTYSIGLTLPFALAGLFFPVIVKLLSEHRLLFHRFSQAAGMFLIAFGMILILEKYRFFLEKFYFFVDVAFGNIK